MHPAPVVEIKRILCPVDLSGLSRHALDHARSIAEWYKASVTIFHVYVVPQPLMPPVAVAIPPTEPAELAEEVRRFSGLTEASAEPPMEIVVVEGSPVKEILRQIDKMSADLVVMGTHGRGGFAALFLGSVTEKVLRSTNVPVLTVPPPVERTGPVVYKTILCPIEFSDPSTRALEYALTLAKESGARLLLLHVVELPVDGEFYEVPEFNLTEYRRQLEESARARLKSALPDEARVWCAPEERVISGKAYRAILDVAEQEKAEIIVMGVHGRGALHRRLFGSTTHHVIRAARCPVLTLRA